MEKKKTRGERLLAIQEEIAEHGAVEFRSFRAGVHISRPADWVQRAGADGGLTVVKEDKPEIHFVDHKFMTTDPETVLYLRTHTTRFGGLGKQYVEVTNLDNEEADEVRRRPARPQTIKEWGKTKADALQALGMREVPVADMRQPTWAKIEARALEYRFEFEGREAPLEAPVVVEE